MHAAAAKKRITPDQLMREGCRYFRERRGLIQEGAILASILSTLGTRCKAWRDCCDDIMTLKWCIEYLKIMGANLAAGKGAAARTQCMYLDRPCWS